MVKERAWMVYGRVTDSDGAGDPVYLGLVGEVSPTNALFKWMGEQRYNVPLDNALPWQMCMNRIHMGMVEHVPVVSKDSEGIPDYWDFWVKLLNE